MSESGWESLARAAGWLPPDEVKLKMWRAKNLNYGIKCAWCGAKRDATQQPHQTHCRFYNGPVTHASAGTGHQGTFDYWINCTCGNSYPMHDAEGNKQECSDREKTWRLPRAPDLSVLPDLHPASGHDTV